MSEEQGATGANGESQQPAREVALRKIYVKDFSFESPGAPRIFMQQDFKPSTNLNLSTKNNKIEDSLYECVLTLTLDAKFDNETAFLVELQQAGVFHLAGYSDQELNMILGTYCPSTLFPYAREAISGAVQRGGFPELLLQPIDFEALFRRSQMEQAQQQQAADA
ncbi:MAG: protein-export chaperone SecB [Pseudomonadota bacterium]